MRVFTTHPPITSHGDDGSITTIYFKQCGSVKIVETEVLYAPDVIAMKYKAARTKAEREELLEEFEAAVNAFNEIYSKAPMKMVLVVPE